MTLMGQRKDRNGARKPSAKPATPQKGREAGKESGLAYKSFMRQFEGIPCTLCGSRGFNTFGGGFVPTVGHHLLFRSIHPEYTMTPENVIPLCPTHHRFAHDKPYDFRSILADKLPERAKWYEAHNHHRKDG